MADFIDTLFGSGAAEFWRGAAPMLVGIAAISFLTHFIKHPKHPKRPDPDPLEGVEFEENGVVKKKEE